MASRRHNEPFSDCDAVMVFDPEATPIRRKWCVFELWRCTELELPLRLFCEEVEITRGSSSPTALALRKKIEEIDLPNRIP